MGKGKGAYPITRGGRVEGFRQRGAKKTKGKTVHPRRVAKRTPERRVFTVHGREYSWTKSQMKKELGVPPEDVTELWKSGQRVLPELPETFDAVDRREERTDAFDADEYHDWAEDARKLCLKAGVSKESVASLWKTLPEGDLAKTDFAWFSIQVIPYGEGETFAVKVENLLKSVNWKHVVNYAIRNIEVGDEEEIRIPEDKAYFMKGFKAEGVSPKDLKKLDEIIVDGHFDLNYDTMLEILKPYMSHETLYDKDWNRWEFQTWTDPEEWDTYEPDPSDPSNLGAY